MIRFIIKAERGFYEGPITEGHYTVDCDVPELENCLTRGGRNSSEFETHKLIGFEILKDKK